MNKLKQLNLLFISFLLGTLVFSCSENVKIETKVDIRESQYFVSMKKATDIATALDFPHVEEKGQSISSGTRKIDKIVAVPDQNGIPTFYIANYKKSGFVMISADNRIYPIRSYSLIGSFPLELTLIPSGLLGWLSETSDMVHQIRIQNEKQSDGVAEAWNISEMNRIICPLSSTPMSRGGCGSDGEGGGHCENRYHIVGPLLKTT